MRYLDREGVAHEKTPAEMEVHYRHVPSLDENFAVSAVFRGEKSTEKEIVRRLEESQEKRRTTQPAAKSAGCIFKNPAACPAGKLVDELGLKNLRVGDARVSEVHGNFIVNEGAATAGDVLELIGKIQAKRAGKARDRIGNRSANRGGARVRGDAQIVWVAHASGVLVAVFHRDELSLACRRQEQFPNFSKSSSRQNAATSTRNACATRRSE